MTCDFDELQAPACWICMCEADSSERGQLIAPCACSKQSGRMAHTRCLARWQLQSAGTRRETLCEFCGEALPDWKAAMTPDCGARAPAIMNVNFAGHTYSFQVRPGPEGYEEFTQAICRAFSLPTDADLSITFTCDEPSTGALLTLQGAGAYDAAVHCASVSAARRQPLTTTSSGSASGSMSPASGGGSMSPASGVFSGTSQPGSPGGSEAAGTSRHHNGGVSDSVRGDHHDHKGPRGLSIWCRRLCSVFSELFHAG